MRRRVGGEYADTSVTGSEGARLVGGSVVRGWPALRYVMSEKHGPFESMEDEIVWCGQHQRPFAACQIDDLRAELATLRTVAETIDDALAAIDAPEQGDAQSAGQTPAADERDAKDVAGGQDDFEASE